MRFCEPRMVFLYGKRKLRSFFWRVRADFKREIKGWSNNINNNNFNYDPFSYSLNFDDGNFGFFCWTNSILKLWANNMLLIWKLASSRLTSFYLFINYVVLVLVIYQIKWRRFFYFSILLFVFCCYGKILLYTTRYLLKK